MRESLFSLTQATARLRRSAINLWITSALTTLTGLAIASTREFFPSVGTVRKDPASCRILHPIHAWALDGIGYLFLSVTSAVAGASGMGGGPIFVPILILTFGFEAEYAIPLSKVLQSTRCALTS